MSHSNDTIPHGLCHCGCGLPAPLAKQNDSKRGYKAGEPHRFISGHNRSEGRVLRYLIEDRGHTTPCWIWQGYLTEDGYGRCKVNGKTIGAHVAMYERVLGPIPIGLELDHLCRVRCCINPNHLDTVASVQNTRRGRSAKLTVEKVSRIKSMLSTHNNAQIAIMHGVTEGAIWFIRKGINWKDVEPSQ